ncbi:unnamed protein product [Fraxinus pennsylvanica]|uniref:S-acyltransferase n=1 Tax=Fraxinus pennsylvanica TaxID=56036 RepID=A0AAD2ECZ8_9LAMI|nr:unnamed protein product [Fraxinus pennsylvanica]
MLYDSPYVMLVKSCFIDESLFKNKSSPFRMTRHGRDLRFCQKCSRYKPPRANHCRICNRCVLRMVLLIGSLTAHSEDDTEDSFRTVYVISGLLLVPLSLALGFFVGWHIYLILKNKTTIEYREGVRAVWIAEKGGLLYSHPCDIGAYENLISILGPNFLFWVCPTSRHVDSGIHFRTKYDILVGTLAEE